MLKGDIEMMFQKVKEAKELINVNRDNLRNIEPEQLKILELEFPDCLKKIIDD